MYVRRLIFVVTQANTNLISYYSALQVSWQSKKTFKFLTGHWQESMICQFSGDAIALVSHWSDPKFEWMYIQLTVKQPAMRCIEAGDQQQQAQRDLFCLSISFTFYINFIALFPGCFLSQSATLKHEASSSQDFRSRKLNTLLYSYMYIHGCPVLFLFQLAYTGWRICGALVQISCYQHRHEWGKGSVVL